MTSLAVGCCDKWISQMSLFESFEWMKKGVKYLAFDKPLILPSSLLNMILFQKGSLLSRPEASSCKSSSEFLRSGRFRLFSLR
jgi:hypothetical protein